MIALFPCWGRHSRMGHSDTYGYFEPGPGSSVTFRQPALPERIDAEGWIFTETPEVVGIRPMEGGAFYGFDVLTEAEVLDALAMRQPAKRPDRPALPAPIEDSPGDPESGGEPDSDDIPW